MTERDTKEEPRARNAGGRGDLENEVGESVYVTLALAARLTGIGKEGIAEMIADGMIGSVVAGELMLIPMSSLRDYLAEQRMALGGEAGNADG